VIIDGVLDLLSNPSACATVNWKVCNSAIALH
jgi:hypothetical protein